MGAEAKQISGGAHISVIGKEQADLAGSRNHLIKSRAIAEVFKFGARFEPTRAAFLKGSADGQRAAQVRLSTAAVVPACHRLGSTGGALSPTSEILGAQRVK